MSSSIGFSLKSRRWIEGCNRDSRLSGPLKQVVRCQLLLVRLGGIGYGWNGGLKYRSSKEELHCSYDVIHWIRIIQMQVWLDDSLPMVNMILERHRKACKEHDIVLHLRELSINDQDGSDLGELPGILSQVVLAVHHLHTIVSYKILDISMTILVSILTSRVQLFNSDNKHRLIWQISSCFRNHLPNLCFI